MVFFSFFFFFFFKIKVANLLTVLGLGLPCSNVPYPLMYAEGTSEEANSFNCVQRGHQNFLENLPIFLVAQLLLASIHPRTAAFLILLWSVGRVVYFLGYSQGDPNKRLPGAIVSALTQLGSCLSLLYLGLRAALKA